ncbi:MAG: hypothetical protein AB3N20_00595 [Rhizobiaceae bacterium]
MASSTFASEQASEIDPVHVFNEVCYSKVPVVDAIREMATRLAWNPISGDDLKRFTALQDPDLLEGWDMQVGERLFRLGVVQSPPARGMAKTFPDFANGTATSCTLILDGQDDPDSLAVRMQALAGKDPESRDVPDGSLNTTTWAGGNADFKVFLFSKLDAIGGGLLNVTILAK